MNDSGHTDVAVDRDSALKRSKSPQSRSPMAAPGTATPPPEPQRTKTVAPTSIRGRLVAGILLVIPLAVTALLIRYIYEVALTVGIKTVNWIHWVFLYVLERDTNGPRLINPDDPQWYYETIAVALTILLLYTLGWFGSNVVGRRVIELFEALVEKIPFVDTVYGAMKRMVQALGGAGKDDESQRVVLVDFPHEQMRAIAFLTNTITDLNSGDRLATVYVPTTPNPTSGYMEIVPVERITLTDWTMEEALSMILSGGATAPPNVRLRPPGQNISMKREPTLFDGEKTKSSSKEKPSDKVS